MDNSIDFLVSKDVPFRDVTFPKGLGLHLYQSTC